MHANRITDSHKEAYKASSVSKYRPAFPSLYFCNRRFRYPAKLVDSMRLLLATNFG